MPVRALNCYLQMIPVIKADESLRFYQAMACGSGAKSKRQASQIRRQVQEWIKTSRRYSDGGSIRRPKNAEEMRAVMAALGITVKEVPRRDA